jgi:molybdenum cofactor biosynthesis protein B
MSEPQGPIPRVLIAAVMHTGDHPAPSRPPGSSSIDPLAKAVTEEVRRAGLLVVRNVVVRGERQYIQLLVSNVSNGNEADAIVMVGGVGIGPRDDTCEAINTFVERRIEGFGEAYRQLLADDLGVQALLVRATAGVYNQCVVFAMAGRQNDVTRAMEKLVLPTLPQAVELATGRRRAGEI